VTEKVIRPSCDVSSREAAIKTLAPHLILKKRSSSARSGLSHPFRHRGGDDLILFRSTKRARLDGNGERHHNGRSPRKRKSYRLLIQKSQYFIDQRYSFISKRMVRRPNLITKIISICFLNGGGQCLVPVVLVKHHHLFTR